MSVNWTAFESDRRIVSGTPAQVVSQLKAAETYAVLVFDDATGRLVDLDLRGSVDACLARLPAELTEDTGAAPRGPGRPKLGVVPREVTLLPRHWDWLNNQPGGASVTLRKLVEAARTTQAPGERKRKAQDATDRFMRAMAGDQPGYEDAARALYRGEKVAFDALTDVWPADIRDHSRRLSAPAFDL